MKRLICGVGFLALGLISNAPPALAQQVQTQYYWGGKTKNFYVDVVFWGWGQLTAEGTKIYNPDGSEATDAESVLLAVEDLSSLFNTGWMIDDSGTTYAPPFGWEPAIHAYGVSGFLPGLWVCESLSISSYMQSQGINTLSDSDFQNIVQQAWARQAYLGAAMDFQNNVIDSAGLTGSPNRLTLVITKGANLYIAGGGATGYHWSMSNNLYGAVRQENIHESLSHEIMEALSDPYPFPGYNAWGTDTPSGFLDLGTESDEIADDCQGLSGDYQYAWAWITVDPAYNVPGYGSTPGKNCLENIPERHADMDATFEYGYRSQPLALVYVDIAGHVEEIEWDSAGGAASAPFDLGPPSATVKAAGKPSIVYSLYGFGERIFVKGTDNALWMHWEPNGGTGTWVSLGGVIYGDPKAVMWDNNQLIDVFALGTDDNIYYYGMTPSILYGWSPLVWPGTLFVNSPTVISPNATSLDLFAPGEDGNLYWMSCNQTTCWTSPSVVVPTNHNPPVPVMERPTVAEDSNGLMELYSNGAIQGMFQVSGSAVGFWPPGFVATPDGTYLEGSPASASWGPGHFDMFGVSRTAELWWWYTNYVTTTTQRPTWTNGKGSGPLVAGNSQYPATGDPLTISRYANEVEVFYRTPGGQIAHLTYTNGAWLPTEINLPSTFSPSSMR